MSDSNQALIAQLLEQNANTTKLYVESMFGALKDEIKALREENSDLCRSLEFTQQELDTVKAKIVNLEGSAQQSALNVDSTVTMGERLRVLEDQSRASNLKITGISEVSNENSEQTQRAVQKLVAEKLLVPEVAVQKAYRVGASTDNSRPIIAKLASADDKYKCFKASSKLKGTDIYLSDDVSKATADIRKGKLDELKQKRREGYIAYFSGTRIVARPRRSQQELPTTPRSDETFNSQDAQQTDDSSGSSPTLQCSTGDASSSPVHSSMPPADPADTSPALSSSAALADRTPVHSQGAHNSGATLAAPAPAHSSATTPAARAPAQGAHKTAATAAARAADNSKKAPQPPNKTTRPTRAVAATKNNFDGVKGKRNFKK